MRFLPLLSLLFASAYGLFINMEPKKTYCFYRSSNKGEKIKINYVCSGKGEKQVGLKVYSYNNKGKSPLLFERSGVSDLRHSYQSKIDQEFKICFVNYDSNKKILDFEFKSQNEKDDLVSKDEVQKLNKELRNNINTIKKIYKNQIIKQTRDEVHEKQIQQTQNTVKLMSVLKMVSLGIICTVQIYVLTSFFKGQKVGV